LIVCLGVSSVVRAGDPPRSALNSVYAEGLGPGLWYSLNYERLLIDDLGVSLGFSYMSMSASAGTTSASVSSLAFPLSAHYIGLGKGSHSLEVNAGVTLLYASGSGSVGGLGASGSGVSALGHFGFGYRYHPRSTGFHFRVGLGGLIGELGSLALGADTATDVGLLPWGYISFGATFGFGETPSASDTEPASGSGGGSGGGERVVEEVEASEAVVAPVSPEDLAEFPDVEVSLAPPALDPASADGVRFGKTSRDDVVDKFGMPKEMKEQGVGTSFIYKASDAFVGFRQVTFHFDEDGLLKQLDTFPASTIGRAQVEDSYQAPAAVKPAGGGFEVMIYPKLGMMVYLKAGKVHSVRFAPKK
jgi:hypothetical protein